MPLALLAEQLKLDRFRGRLGSPGGGPGIRLPGCSFTTSIVVDDRFPSTLAMRSTQSSGAARGVACECAGSENPTHTRKHATVRDFILCRDEGWILL